MANGDETDPDRSGQRTHHGRGAAARRVAVRHVDRFWTSDWSLTTLLVLLVVIIFFVHPFKGLGYDATLIGGVVFTFILVSGIISIGSRAPITASCFAAVAVVSASVHWARIIVFGPPWLGKDAIASFVACGMLATIVLWQVFREGPITSLRIQGALAAYLLVGLMFSTLYTWIDLNVPNAFSGPAPISELSDNPLGRFVYFSFVTLTTVGYGDISPLAPEARSMAMLEALIGQIFPAILLARLVSLELYYRQQRRAVNGGDSGP